MKKLFFVFVCVLTSVFSYAYANTGCTNNLAVGIEKSPIDIQQIAYTLHLGDITNVSNGEVTNSISNFISQIPSPSELDCSVTVTAEVNAGVVKGTIEVTVSGPCDEIAKKGKDIAEKIIKDINDQL